MNFNKGNKKLFALILLFFGQIIISLSDINIPISRESGVTGSSISKELHNSISSLPPKSNAESKIKDFMDEWGIAGASVAIAKDERLIYAKGFGVTDTTTNETVQPKHMFRIASISKLITSVGIMKLVEKEKLSLNSKVFGGDGILSDSRYTEIRDPRVKDITIRHLLTHSAGWAKNSGDPIFIPYTIKSAMDVSLPVDIETTIRYTLKYRKLDFDPGSKSSYSNFGYVVLGEIIENITGRSYEEYISSEILNPIGIYDMQLGNSFKDNRLANEVKYYSNSNFTRSYSSFLSGKIVPRQYGGNNLNVLGAAGAWLASPAELLKLSVHIDGSDRKNDILSDTTIKQMTDTRDSLHPIGWVSTDNNGTWKRTGTLTGTSALLKRCGNGLTWVILLNTSNDKGHNFTDNLDSLMTNVTANINDWPDYDLFYYSDPKPLYSYSKLAEY
jgi:CubicO group peptidase (beta-lactamase class C family)